MNLDEHALTCVIEECSELIQCATKLQKATAKALRFGLDDGYPGTTRTNRADMAEEANDLLGALEYLAERQALPGLFDRQKIEAKKKRIEHWQAHALRAGALSIDGSSGDD